MLLGTKKPMSCPLLRADKTSLQEIEDRVVKAGHSTAGKAAEQADYDQLPACCRYEELHKH